jgi:hypothetical protein
MTEEQIALARRAVACKGWRWLGGMRTANEERVIGVMRDGVLHLCAPLDAALESVSITRVFFDSSGSCLPDLTDAATLGCLLALVRKARREPTYLPTLVGIVDKWVISPPITWRQTRYESYAAALVAALEAAA